MDLLDTSFDDSEGMDASDVIATELYGHQNKDFELATQQHIKKLSEAFEGCIRSDNTLMKVYLRIRPIVTINNSKSEVISTIQVNNATTITTTAPDTSKRAQYTKTEERNYIFTRVFGPTTEQPEIFDEVGKPLLERFLRGESCVLFAYGMTNSGKTHTIQGHNNNPGLLPRMVDHILAKVARENTKSCTYELNISMLEIYQEKVFDLLSKRRDKLIIRDGNGHVEVVKLSISPISCSNDAVKLLDIAASNRSKANTLLNSGSSRSHAVYTLTLKQHTKRVDNTIVNTTNFSVFHVVDLAGAERSTRTKANFLQLKEANNINVSLMQLWRCLQCMKKKIADGSSSTGMDTIPYRESKLTHLLMPELGRAGIAGVAMVTCVNPHGDDYDETVSILGNASIACKITELADIGRPTISQQTATTQAPTSMISSIFSHFNSSSSSSVAMPTNPTTSSTTTEVILQASKQAMILANKRKRENDGTTTTSTLTNSTISSAMNTVVGNKRNVLLNNTTNKAIRKNSVTSTMVATGVNSNNATNVVSSTTFTSNNNLENMDIEDIQELKRLRIEVIRLEQENSSLLNDQLQRETEIRHEIAVEMAKRSESLLQQIHKLQRQLSDREIMEMSDRTSGSTGSSLSLSSSSSLGSSETRNSHMNNSSVLQRSVKKAKRQHLDKVNEEVYEELQQLQEEYDHMKSSYEQQISALQEEKEVLLLELQDWKSRAHASTTTLEQLQLEVSRDLSPTSSSRGLVSMSSVRSSNDLSYQTIPSSFSSSSSSLSSQILINSQSLSQSYNKRGSKKHSKGSTGKGKNKKSSSSSSSSMRSQLTASLEETQRQGLSSVTMLSTKRNSPLSGSNHYNSSNSVQQLQPIFPPKSPARPLSPARSRSPITSSASKRSVSPNSSKAPFVVKNIYSNSANTNVHGNDENSNMNSNSNIPIFGQVSQTAGLTEATAPDGSTYFKRLRSHFAMRA